MGSLIPGQDVFSWKAAAMKVSGAARRRVLRGALGSAATVIGFPMLNFGAYQVFAGTPKTYSARAVKLVERSLVVDMLGVIKIDFRPEAYALPLTPDEVAAFKASGINAFHNAQGTGGPNAKEQTLSFLASWLGFVGRHSDLFLQVDKAADLDRAKASGKIAVIAGVQ